MTIEDIVALTKAGFSKDEILALTGDPSCFGLERAVVVAVVLGIFQYFLRFDESFKFFACLVVIVHALFFTFAGCA